VAAHETQCRLPEVQVSRQAGLPNSRSSATGLASSFYAAGRLIARPSARQTWRIRLVRPKPFALLTAQMPLSVVTLRSSHQHAPTPQSTPSRAARRASPRPSSELLPGPSPGLLSAGRGLLAGRSLGLLSAGRGAPSRPVSGVALGRSRVACWPVSGLLSAGRGPLAGESPGALSADLQAPSPADFRALPGRPIVCAGDADRCPPQRRSGIDRRPSAGDRRFDGDLLGGGAGRSAIASGESSRLMCTIGRSVTVGFVALPLVRVAR
jgi:hypothetical protein